MNIILYPKNEKLFDNNGIGILSDAIDAEVYEELNGQFELTVKYPVEGIHFAEIAKEAIITAKPNPVSDPQPFDIYRITKPTNGVVTLYARHAAYKNRKITVSPFTAASVSDALQGLKNNAVNNCPFEFWTDKSTAGDFTVKVPAAIWTLLGNSEGSILDTYGGEYEFDRWTVKLHNRRGADRGVSIRYGKNLTSLEQDENCANVYTGVYPYWADLDGNVVMLPEKVVMTADAYEDEMIMPLDLSQAFDTAPTEEQLRAKTESYIKANDIGKPDVSWTVEFVQLEQTEEYKGKALLERVLLGDTVSVVFPKLGVDVSARAVAARYLPLLGRYKNITLGKVRANIADTIVQQGQSIEKKPSVSLMQSIIMTLTASILGARGGAVRLLDTDGDGMPDTLYVADNADPALAMKVWRWNYAGWAGSKTGYNGPFTIGATLKDGLLAEAVTAANLVAGTIKSADGKTFFLDLDNGILKAVFTELSIAVTADVYLPPTHDDVMAMLWSLSFPSKYPPKDFYDLNGDGSFNRDDIILARDIYLGKVSLADCSGAHKTTVTVSIDPSNSDETILISGTNMWGSKITTSIGASNSSIPVIKGNCAISGKMAIGGDAIIQTLATDVEGTAKTLSWKDNGDGTYTLIGK